MAATSRIGMRKIWFQIHKWIGLLLAILIIPLCLTGSALVWHDWLDAQINPQRYTLTEGAMPASAYFAAASAALQPGERINAMRREGDGPIVVSAARAPQANVKPAGPPARTMIWLDPGSARVLDKADSSTGLVRVLHNLHGNLMIPEVGRQVVGWIGVAMLVSSISGLWLWWPTIGSWRRGLRWRRHNDFDTNLHHLFGFWIALPLFVLSLTGAWISFPQFFASFSGGAQQGGGGGDRAARMRAMPLDRTATGVDSAVAAVNALQAGRWASITWPTDQKAEWAISIAREGRDPLPFSVDDVSGEAKAQKPRPPSAALARTMRKIHDGADMGPVWQTIIFVGGILPAALAVTGIIMWLRSRTWRGDVARRQRDRVEGIAPAE